MSTHPQELATDNKEPAVSDVAKLMAEAETLRRYAEFLKNRADEIIAEAHRMNERLAEQMNDTSPSERE